MSSRPDSRCVRRSILVLTVALLVSLKLAAQAVAPSTAPNVQAAPASDVQRELDSGHPDAALRLADALPPGSAKSHSRGSALYALGRLQEADAALAGADPTDLGAVQLHGLVLFRLGKPAAAIPLLERAHAWTEQTRADPAYVLALCYIDVHRFDDARRAFAEQYGFPPDSAAAHLLTARMLLRREYVPNALEEARKAVAVDPGLPLAHRLLGEIALAGDHALEAIAEFEMERQRNPLDGTTYDRLGDAYARTGEYSRAEQMLERALLLEPTATAPYILLGKVLLRRQDAASATGYLERAEKMDPANPITHSLLGQAYRATGRLEDSRREVELFQKLGTQEEPKLQPLR